LFYLFVSGYDWSSLTDAQTCDSAVCQNAGICLPRPAGETEDNRPFCLCPPGFTGPTCSLTMSTCEENPCRNGASCTEDPSGGTGYECQCFNSSYQGRHCELEAPHCMPNSCLNGGTCLSQPGGFICECTAQYSGLRCENPARVRLIIISLYLFASSILYINKPRASNVCFSFINFVFTTASKFLQAVLCKKYKLIIYYCLHMFDASFIKINVNLKS
jgi:hypothetical protein